MSDNLCERCYKKPYYCDIRAHGSGGGTISCTSFHPQTNADRIRVMTDEELARLLGGLSARAYDWVDSTEEEVKKWLEWLHKEAEE